MTRFTRVSIIGVLVAVLAIAHLAPPRCPATTPPPAEGTLAAANELYRQGKYDEAVKAYQRLLTTAPDTAVLYNLGNACFKLFQLEPDAAEGMLGRAIQCYERVLRVDPRDRDALANLTYARTLLVDKFEAPPDDGGIWGLVVQAYHLPTTSELETAASLLVWLLMGVLVLRRSVRRETTSELLFWLLFLILPLTLLIGGWAASRAWDDEARREAVVLVRQADARSAPQDDGTHVFTLHEGTKVRVVRSSNGWTQVSLPNGFAGWMRFETLGPID